MLSFNLLSISEVVHVPLHSLKQLQNPVTEIKTEIIDSPQIKVLNILCNLMFVISNDQPTTIDIAGFYIFNWVTVTDFYNFKYTFTQAE